MTLVLKEADPKHHLQSTTELQTVFFTSTHENRILHVDAFPRFPIKKKIQFPKEIFKSSLEVNVSTNFIDTGISICSLDVLALFSENFDYQTIIGDFVKGICTSDLLSSTIYADIIDSGVHGSGCYAAGINGTRSYAQIAFDIINRWSFPISPELFPTDPPHHYSYNRNNLYIGNKVVLARSCSVGPRSILGHNSKIENGVLFRDSVCGDSTFIDSNTKICDSHIFSFSKIGSGCTITNSLIGSNVTILDNVVLSDGCIIGNNVTIGPNVTIPKFTRIFNPQNNHPNPDSPNSFDKDHISSPNSLGYDKLLVGTQGIGCLYVSENQDEDWESQAADPRCELVDHIGFNLKLSEISPEEMNDDYNSDSDYSGSSEDDSDLDSEGNGFESEGYYEKAQKNLDLQKQTDFKNELAATIKRAFEENHTVATAALELNTLRMAYDGNLELMRRVIIESIIGQIDITKNYKDSTLADGAKHLASSVKILLEKWSVLINKNIYSIADQGDSIGIVFEYLLVVYNDHRLSDSSDSTFGPFISRLFLLIVRFLYEFDVLEGDSIINWYNNKTDDNDDVELDQSENLIVSGLEKFVDWLDEDSDSDADDDDDGGDSDGDDDSDE
ncbi:putative translation initiation factor eIF-2B subunit epsilon [Smittium mucronatum]|uniref:Putative translation initiation factor eIF-2B subunit epsilon n=1 Tax=Smittium mucronatum TaxID=133383 RepID=A0A1R0H715_9FUNG|nr:putative translation initiation factor eIF-2B subunit epsilon [Smittium mucronatum]